MPPNHYHQTNGILNSLIPSILSLLTLFSSNLSFAANGEKGLLPEVQMDGSSEEENQKRASLSEAMIAKTEAKAIDALEKLVIKKKGSQEEPQLLYRLAELYMRKAKSGRFFDLNPNEKQKLLSAFPVPLESDKESLRKAVKNYTRIENEFKNFQDMDAVLFNSAFAHQQLRLSRVAEELLQQLISKFPKSILIPDALLALAEIQYESQRFGEAFKNYKKVEAYPESRAYSYAVYKSAWAAYNLKDSKQAIEQLKLTLKNTPAGPELSQKGHNLRSEALRDMGIFTADTAKAEDIYSFFKKIATPEELSKVIVELAKMYDSHSRQKEMLIFLNDYIKNESETSGYVQALMMMVDASETLKKRDQVIHYLEMASRACKIDSSWRKEQSDEVVQSSCKSAFRHTSLEITKKWWEIWIKNKENKGKDVEDFADLTEKSFSILMESDDAVNPDYKNRYAYADLLFQRKKFLLASEQYQRVSIDAKEQALKHDSDYNALLSLDRHLEEKKDSKLEIQRRVLSENYVKNHPKGEHVREVLLKLSQLSFLEKDFKSAETYIQQILSSPSHDEIATKAEDILLDIANQKQDTKRIKELSQSFRAKATTPERQKSLTQIFEEATMADIQALIKANKGKEAIPLLEDFVSKNPNSKLMNDAQWQLIGLLFANQLNDRAIEQTKSFSQRNPNDKRSEEANNEIVRIQIEQANLIAAAEFYKKQKDLVKSATLYLLDHDLTNFFQIVTELDKSKKSEDVQKLILQAWSQKEELPASATSEIKKWIQTRNIEPMTTEFLVEDLEKMYTAGKTKQSFEYALKIMKRDSPASVRARARMIQAKILEAEHKSQSVKAKADKLVLVIAMKTEKLDKAQTAYLSATKMFEDPRSQIEAFKGISRVYDDFVTSLSNIQLPEELSPADKTALKNELSAIINPIQNKKIENDAQIDALIKKGVATEDSTTQWKAVASNFRILIPEKFDQEALTDKTKFLAKTEACSKHKDLSAQALANCFVDSQLDALQRLVNKDMGNQAPTPLSLYSKVLIAESQKKTTKAIWILDRAISKFGNLPILVYEKARLLFSNGDISEAGKLFSSLSESKSSLTEISIFLAMQESLKRDYKKASDIFSRISPEVLLTYQVRPIALEAHNLAGNTDRAKELQKAEAVKKPKNH